MKSKKGFIELNNIKIVSILILAIIIIASGMILIKNIFEKPEFKITQEECWEKYRYSTSESDCDFGMVKKDCPQEKLESLSKSKNFPNNINWTCCYEKTCKDVEIKEIEICSGSYLCKDRPGCCLGYYLETDSLTIEWLEKRCLCQDCHGTWDTMYDGCDISCSEYKCGDYKVEVIK